MSLPESKIIPFLYLELPQYQGEKEKRYRIIIYDGDVEWDNQSMYLMEELSDDLSIWTNAKKEKKLEAILKI